jgi:hypothetical protein
VSEPVVQRYEDELEAETAAGLLRANGITARVSYRATMGAPRSVVPTRVVAPMGDCELRVASADEARARDTLADAGPPMERPRRYRWLGWILLVAFFFPLLWNAVAALYALR